MRRIELALGLGSGAAVSDSVGRGALFCHVGWLLLGLHILAATCSCPTVTVFSCPCGRCCFSWLLLFASAHRHSQQHQPVTHTIIVSTRCEILACWCSPAGTVRPSLSSDLAPVSGHAAAHAAGAGCPRTPAPAKLPSASKHHTAYTGSVEATIGDYAILMFFTKD